MLSVYDYVVIAFYFAFMTLMGWIFKRFISNTSDYFRGGGEMLWWVAGSSAFMVAFSAWTFTGAASKAYQDGAIIAVIFFANALGFFFNYLYFAPRFRQMRLITAIEGVRERFGRGNEQLFTWIQLPLGVLYAAIWLNGLAVFVAAVFGMDITWTILVTGAVVVVMSVIGGSWAVVAGDFIQVMILMPITIVACVLALAAVGGPGLFVERVPAHFFDWTAVARPQIVYLWVFAILIKQFISTNNMLDASRYLNVKDGRHARKAALLAMTLMLIGPFIWFVPPMAARVLQPDIAAQFPQLGEKASEAAFVSICMATFPAGMMGLLVSGIFAATMSSMDSGLNRNAGFFIKNFYQPIVRRDASEGELMVASKITTLAMGVLVILAALKFSTLKGLSLFDLMVQFGTLVAVPFSVPLVLGMLIRRAPGWAGWSTMAVTFVASLLSNWYINENFARNVLGFTDLSRREVADWIVIVGLFVNVGVGTAWFLMTTLFTQFQSDAERQRIVAFFDRIETPVDFEKEEGAGSDNLQLRTMGLLTLVYGGFVALLVLIPNGWTGRAAFAFVALVMAGVGYALLRASKRVAPVAGEQTHDVQPVDIAPVTPPARTKPVASS